MKSSQIIVRSKLIKELKENEHKGIWHGKYLLVSPEEIQNEINRRLRLARTL